MSIRKMSNWMLAMLLASSSLPASAFNIFDWYMKEAVEDAAAKVVKDAAVNAVKGAGSATSPGVPSHTKAGESASLAEGRDYVFLPLTGKYRFSVPENMAASMESLEIGARGGYIDRFGNEWVPIKGKKGVMRWHEYLSEQGQFRMTWAAEGKTEILVGRDGKIAK